MGLGTRKSLCLDEWVRMNWMEWIVVLAFPFSLSSHFPYPNVSRLIPSLSSKNASNQPNWGQISGLAIIEKIMFYCKIMDRTSKLKLSCCRTPGTNTFVQIYFSQDDADLIKDCQKYLYNMYVMFSTSFELDTLKFFPLEFLLDQLIKIIIYLKVQT